MSKNSKIVQISAIDATMDKLLRRLNELSIEELIKKGLSILGGK